MPDEAPVKEAPKAGEAIGKPEPPMTIREAIREVQEKVAKGEPLVPEEEPQDAVPVGEAAEVDVGEQAGDGESLDGGGEEPEREDARPPEQPEAEGEGEGEKPEVEADLFTVKLPPRRSGEDPVELDLEGLPEEAKEGFKRLMNEGLRRDQLDAAMEEVRVVQAEVQQVLDAMSVDPINFVLERTQPDLRAQLAYHILSDPQIYDLVIPEIAKWDRSVEAREAAQARLERDRIISQREAEQRLALRERSRANAKQLWETVNGMVPDDAPEHIRDLFTNQAMGALQTYAAQAKADTIDPAQVERILSQTHVLRLLEAQGGVRATSNPPEPSSAGPVKAAPGKSLREAEETAQRFRQTSARKRSASAVAPPGAGPAPNLPPQPSEEDSRDVRSAIKWYRREVMGQR